MLTVFLYIPDEERTVMCHCFGSVDELSEQEREELVEEHSIEELQAEHSEEDLKKLEVSV